MAIIAGVFVAVLCAVTLWLALRLQVLRREYNALHEQMTEANALAGAVPPDVDALLAGSTSTLITIEILNPMQLAANESWVAGKFGSLTPGLVRRVVYDRALKITEETLTRFGAEALVEVRRAP